MVWAPGGNGNCYFGFLLAFSKERVVLKQGSAVITENAQQTWLAFYSVSTPKDTGWNFHVFVVHLLLKLFGFCH